MPAGLAPSSERQFPLERRRFVVDPQDAGQRLDRYLAERLDGFSRTRIQQLIATGCVRVAGAASKPSRRLVHGEAVEVAIPPEPALEVTPEPIPLAVLYEDEDVAVIDKPPGMIVHAGAGTPRGTLAAALLHRFASLSTVGGPLRPGIVHRLDKGTSGVLLVARNNPAHRFLVEQFRLRRVHKTYLALVHGRVKKDQGAIELPVARDRLRRTRMTTRRHAGRPARTSWRVLLRLDGFTLLEVDLHTGRTHQIRVHLAALGHPVVGDALYGAPRRPKSAVCELPISPRTFLHAARIRFLHPRRGADMEARAPLPQDLRGYLHALASALGIEPGRVDAAARPYL